MTAPSGSSGESAHDAAGGPPPVGERFECLLLTLRRRWFRDGQPLRPWRIRRPVTRLLTSLHHRLSPPMPPGAMQPPGYPPRTLQLRRRTIPAHALRHTVGSPRLLPGAEARDGYGPIAARHEHHGSLSHTGWRSSVCFAASARSWVSCLRRRHQPDRADTRRKLAAFRAAGR